MKIITKQISNKDIINKSRHLTGLHRWSRSSTTVGFIMLVLEWFTIPFEVLFRRDFGQRWLTSVNFFAGGFLIMLFWSVQYNWHLVGQTFVHLTSWFGHVTDRSAASDSDSAYLDAIDSIVMGVLFLMYMVLGAYQLFKIKWRNQVNIPLHSFDDGTSRWRWLAAILKWILNGIFTPLMIILWLFFPIKQRRGKPFPKLISDTDAFTNVFVEPGIVIVFGCMSTSIASFYFFISGMALYFHAHWKEMARKSKILDFQDSRIEAETMKELRNADDRAGKIVAKGRAYVSEHKTQSISESSDRYHKFPIGHYPKLSVIIEELNSEKLQRNNQAH